MAESNPSDVAGAQLALIVAVQLLLSPHRGNAASLAALESELEAMRARLLASPAEERKIAAFEDMAETLLTTLRG